jgi:glycosyltransferase involved in cell wall biosynthesis
MIPMQLSIIIPVHNRADLLAEAIDSIIAQGLDFYEIIICDDGSTENIEAACDRFKLPKEQPVFSRTEESHGAQVARNRGLSLAQGEFIMFMDSDDAVAENGLAPLIEALQADADLQYAYGKVTRVDETLSPIPEDIPVGATYADIPSEIAGYHWHTMGAIYRKSYLELVGPWNVEMTGSQDWEYQARVKLAGGKRVFVDSMVGYWRQHGGDRVGAAKFRPDYVKSVMIGCDSILHAARDKGRCDLGLEKRLAKRLVVHALEWGANNHRHDRKKCFLQAKSCLSSGLLFKAGLSLAVMMGPLTPAFLDQWMMQKIRGC